MTFNKLGAVLTAVGVVFCWLAIMFLVIGLGEVYQAEVSQNTQNTIRWIVLAGIFVGMSVWVYRLIQKERSSK